MHGMHKCTNAKCQLQTNLREQIVVFENSPSNIVDFDVFVLLFASAFSEDVVQAHLGRVVELVAPIGVALVKVPVPHTHTQTNANKTKL